MPTASIIYLGDLRTEAEHIRSGKKFITDAPTDNKGKGEAFSPSDTVSAALASCMITIMGIAANTHKLNINGTKAEVTKHMESDPRRISRIEVRIQVPAGSLNDKDKQILERAALNCPVAKSLHPDLIQDVQFEYVT